jgi:hypothetical protein
VPGKGHRRLRPVCREGHESLALTPGEDDSENFRGGHIPSVGDGCTSRLVNERWSRL